MQFGFSFINFLFIIIIIIIEQANTTVHALGSYVVYRRKQLNKYYWILQYWKIKLLIYVFFLNLYDVHAKTHDIQLFFLLSAPFQ